ncbi:MAG: hypothetical protein WCB63_16930 [Polyangiales bacterium]
MLSRKTTTTQWIIASALSMASFGCGESSSGAAGTTGRGGTGGAQAAQVLPGLGFVASSFGFYYPDDPSTGLDGFNLDDRVSSSDSPGVGECAHNDWMSPDQEPGIDYGFLEIIGNEALREDGKHVFGGFHEGQLVDGVIGGAVKNGSMTILLQIEGLDDPQNDDDVRVQIYSSEDSPALGTDNSVLLGATLGVNPDPRFHSGSVKGALVDGMLVAGPIDLLFPIDIMIVKDELLIHDSWLRLELREEGFEGTVSGYWDVSNIRDIIGVPTTDNGNAANFSIEQFDAAMAELADGNYDADIGLCTSFSTMFRFSGVQAFIVSDSLPGGTEGSSGSGGGGVAPTPLDQCLNAADQAALQALATQEQSGPAVVGSIAADCPIGACGTEVAGVLSDSSEAARNALGDCIARCISEQAGLSSACTSCYGSIAACLTAFCIAPCIQDAGSQECTNCALENCIDVNACTGLY